MATIRPINVATRDVGVPEVGIRDLRDHLSRWIGRVRQGEEIVVTDHGRAVARIVPFETPRRLDQLIAEGKVTPAATARRTLPRRVRATRPVSPLVDDQRR